MFLILDTSAFLSGRFNSIPDGFEATYITSEVRSEVSRGAPSRLLDNLLLLGLEIRDPSDKESARKAAGDTGDLEELSDADISVIALAFELEETVVVTDDFRIQNILKKAGIGFEPAGEIGDMKIQHVWKWTFRCRGCGRYFERSMKNDECPVCGSQVRSVRRK